MENYAQLFTSIAKSKLEGHLKLQSNISYLNKLQKEYVNTDPRKGHKLESHVMRC